MPPKSKPPAERKALFAKVRQLWTELTYADWLALVAELAPASGFVRKGEHITGRCPFHDDPGPSFVITPAKGMVKCFGCHKSFYNPVTFVAALRNPRAPNFSDTVLALRKRFGRRAAIPDALHERLREHEVYQDLKNKLCGFFCEQLFEAIAAYPMETNNDWYWAKPTVEYLMTRRLGDHAPHERRPADAEDGEGAASPADPHGIWPAITSNRLLGIFPPKANVINRFREQSEEYKFFCSYFGSLVQDNFASMGYLVFPLHDEPGSVCRFKLRAPSSDSKVMFFVDDAYEAEMGGFRGFYGLHYYRTVLGLQSPDSKAYADTVVVMEGEFDTLASIARQIRHQSPDFIALALGGASLLPLDRLVTYGIEKVRIVADRDRGGDGIVQRVLERTQTDKLSFSMFNWPDEYVEWRDPTDPDRRIKDPDEAVKWLGYPRWARHVNSAQSYWQPHEWCFEQASREISRIETDDVKQRNRLAITWGRLLRTPQECRTFCAVVAKHFELDPNILFREIRAKDENEEAFIERLCDVLSEHFHLVGIQKGEGGKRLLVLWSKRDRVTETIVLNDERAIETAFARYFGAIYQFIAEHVGEPAFMAPESAESFLNVTARVKKYREYLNFALLRLSQGLPSLDRAPTKAQGLHYVSTVNGEMSSFMVNGRDVYKIVHGDADKFEVRQLDGPSDQGTIFDNAGEAWLHSVKKPEDITQLEVDIPSLFLRLRDMIDSGWSFRHQALDVTFLAAYVMALPIMTVFTRQAALMLNAEAESGKSRFTSGFIGGSGFPRINVVAHAVAMQGYTAASIRQQRNNSSLTLCLEEFEDYGTNDSKSVTVRKVLDMSRDLISESPVNWSIGTPSGESRTYHLRYPMVCCAIKPLRDAASLSRFVGLELVKDSRRVDPVIALIEKFGDEGIQRVRHELAVGLIRHMPRVRQIQAEMEKEYSSSAMLPAYASSRFRESLYPSLVMLRLATEEAQKKGDVPPEFPEYRQFAYDFAESRKDQLSRLKTSSENEQIFESILSSSIQIANTEDHRMSWVTTIRIMLADVNKLDDVNKTKKGVYLDKRTEWLVVNWIEATQGVLANCAKYRNETTTFLKQVSERSPHYVSTAEVKKARVLERLVHVMGPCQSLDLITVFSVRHLLEEARKSRAETESSTPPRAGASGPPRRSDGAETVDDITA